LYPVTAPCRHRSGDKSLRVVPGTRETQVTRRLTCKGVPGSSPGASTKFSRINSNSSRLPDSPSGSDSNCRGPICGPFETRGALGRTSRPASHLSRAMGSSLSAVTKLDKQITDFLLQVPVVSVPTGPGEVIYIFCLQLPSKSCRTGALLYDRLRRPHPAGLWPSIFRPEWRKGRRAGLRTHSTTRNLVPSCPIAPAVPRIFGIVHRHKGPFCPPLATRTVEVQSKEGPILKIDLSSTLSLVKSSCT